MPGQIEVKAALARLKPLLDSHKGKSSVAVKHLTTGESFRIRSEVPMPTASLIKFQTSCFIATASKFCN